MNTKEMQGMVTQYYKVIGDTHIPERGEFIIDGEDVIGFVYASHLFSYDCVLFEQGEFGEYENMVNLAEKLKWGDVIKMMKEALRSLDEELLNEWELFFNVENVDGRFNGEENED